MREKDGVTLEFVALCDYMQQHFDPSNNGEIRRNVHLSYAVCHDMAIKLKPHRDYFSPIPSLSEHSMAKTKPRIAKNGVQRTRRNRPKYSNLQQNYTAPAFHHVPIYNPQAHWNPVQQIPVQLPIVPPIITYAVPNTQNPVNALVNTAHQQEAKKKNKKMTYLQKFAK